MICIFAHAVSYTHLDVYKRQTHVTSFEELPINCQNYLKRISELVHCPIAMFSVGPDREQTIILKEVI